MNVERKVLVELESIKRKYLKLWESEVDKGPVYLWPFSNRRRPLRTARRLKLCTSSRQEEPEHRD